MRARVLLRVLLRGEAVGGLLRHWRVRARYRLVPLTVFAVQVLAEAQVVVEQVLEVEVLWQVRHPRALGPAG